MYNLGVILTHSFSQMKLLRADQIHKHLICCLCSKFTKEIYIYVETISLWIIISMIIVHDKLTITMYLFYRTEMRKHCHRYCEAEIWNKILVTKIDITCSEYVFGRELKNKILVGQVWLFPCTVNMMKKQFWTHVCCLYSWAFDFFPISFIS